VLNICERKNKYDVMDENGTKIYTLLEDSSWIGRAMCANARPFRMNLFKTSNDISPILTFVRPFRCMGCCSDCCYPNHVQLLEVYHEGTNNLGKMLEQPMCCCNTVTQVWDNEGQKIYDVKGHGKCSCTCGSEIPFEVNIDKNRQF
jgi:hypothetical protein